MRRATPLLLCIVALGALMGWWALASRDEYVGHGSLRDPHDGLVRTLSLFEGVAAAWRSRSTAIRPA